MNNDILLQVTDLHAGIESREILRGINLPDALKDEVIMLMER